MWNDEENRYLYELYDLGRELAFDQGVSTTSEVFEFALAFATELNSWPLSESVECANALREMVQ